MDYIRHGCGGKREARASVPLLPVRVAVPELQDHRGALQAERTAEGVDQVGLVGGSHCLLVVDEEGEAQGPVAGLGGEAVCVDTHGVALGVVDTAGPGGNADIAGARVEDADRDVAVSGVPDIAAAGAGRGIRSTVEERGAGCGRSRI